MTYEHGTYSIPVTDTEVRYFDFDLPEVDTPRELVTVFARADGVEILEGPPEVVFGTEWLGELAQVWKYPARRRA